MALWSDHGVVHIRDVAQQVPRVLEIAHGVLIPRRNLERFEFMKAYGVLVAYVHDIGMFDFSPFGRAMHPEFAAQTIMGSEFDDLVAAIQSENCGGIVHHLANLAQRGIFQDPPLIVLREMLALAMCHSKSKVPVGVLNSPDQLREQMQHTLSTDLHLL